MFFTKYYKQLLIIPAVLSALAILALAVWGLRPGIDIGGGSLLEVTYTSERPAPASVQEAVGKLGIGNVLVQPSGDSGFILRQRDLTNAEKIVLEDTLLSLGAMEENQFTSIGPSIGEDIFNKGMLALALVVVATILFIAFAFRKVSEPVSSWKYGMVVIVSLVHDVLIPAGVFAVLGAFSGAEVGSLFIVALLTIMGVSINDTIVVFDRIRENLMLNVQAHRHEDFAVTVGRSVSQTLTRSINTSMTVIIVLISLFFLGPVSTQDFALTLLVGMIAGTYSSIILASPLLILWEKWSRKA